VSRARNIKPGFFKNELLVELPFEFRLLFIGLWTMADREGRLEDRPTKIRMELFPADAVDVNAGLQSLADAGFIQRYETEGKRLIQVTEFAKHQNPHMKEAKSILPAPCKPGASTVQATDKAIASPADSLIPDSLIPSEAIASGASAPGEPEQVKGVPAAAAADPIWHTGLAFLTRKGIPSEQARKFLGKLKREAGDIDAAALLADAEAQDITDPVPWLSAGAVTARERAKQRGSPSAPPMGKQMQGLMALEAMKSGNRMAAGRGTERVAEDVLLVAGPDTRG